MQKEYNEANLLFKEESYQIIGAAMEVHRELGCGFVEPIYQEALEKAVKEFSDEHYAQIYNYLRASRMDLGLLINFGTAPIEFQRVPASTKWR